MSPAVSCRRHKLPQTDAYLKQKTLYFLCLKYFFLPPLSGSFPSLCTFIIYYVTVFQKSPDETLCHAEIFFFSFFVSLKIQSFQSIIPECRHTQTHTYKIQFCFVKRHSAGRSHGGQRDKCIKGNLTSGQG